LTQKTWENQKVVTRSITAVRLLYTYEKEENGFIIRIASLPFLGGVVFTTGTVKPVQNEHF
jgi:hypothetical protein